MKPKILLNCFPPVSTVYPSLALSVLKSFLTVNGYEPDVKYWNIALKEFATKFFEGRQEYMGDYDNLMPYINYMWVRSNENLENCNIKYKLLSMFPRWYNLEADYVEKRMARFANELEEIIASEISKIGLELSEIVTPLNTDTIL